MAAAATRGSGDVLRTWLTMLGWQVEVERDGDLHVGVARHVRSDGERLVVGACAPSAPEAVWQLFEGAARRLAGDLEPLPAIEPGAPAAA